ncbi:histidinol-phosphate transaminase [Rhodocytophaga rosea]|uniref:Histidinol-phosphate aminotransferase n=1 Tax=Rhodocytophaga rosea TaxID=2704465 RepID=A0A6C0GRL4_9BACT|nr:histidinol-phosphate transaminase [Rhodocytophaga rosea]QHT70130.1 histidinol-phosphate transaminase [Rhodocytophaga rosea]
MFDLKKILRPHILTLTPYASARDEYAGTEGIFLDANENPLGSVTPQPYNRYPDPYQWSLKEKISSIRNVPAKQIFLGNGSDEAIDLIIRATCTPAQDEVILLPPTYGMYEVSANIHEVRLVKVPLTPQFQIDVPAVLKAITPRTKLIFLCSPNNPTGNLLRKEDMQQIIKQFNGLVVVDEAYIDFAPEHTFVSKLQEYENLVVLQTFSKAWGLAGLRLGMAFASEEIVQVLNKLKPPYNISILTQEVVEKYIDNIAAKDRMVTQILSDKQLLIQHLQQLPIVEKIHPSDANFLLVKVSDASSVYRHLVNDRIIVRDRSKVILCEGCLRISVGNGEENNQLVTSLKSFSKMVSV